MSNGKTLHVRLQFDRYLLVIVIFYDIIQIEKMFSIFIFANDMNCVIELATYLQGGVDLGGCVPTATYSI